MTRTGSYHVHNHAAKAECEEDGENFLIVLGILGGVVIGAMVWNRYAEDNDANAFADNVGEFMEEYVSFTREEGIEFRYPVGMGEVHFSRTVPAVHDGDTRGEDVRFGYRMRW